MSKVKMAQTINFFLCEHCSAVHIGMYRDGKMFAEAIPDDPIAVAAALNQTIAESLKKQAAAVGGRLN